MKRNFTLALQLTLSVTLTLLTHAAFSQGSGHALDFDGVDDFVEVPHSTSLELDDTLTLSMWLYVPNANNKEYPLRKWISSNGQWSSYSVFLTNSEQLGFTVHNQSLGQFPSWTTTANLPVGSWVHCAFVYTKGNYNGSDLEVYINGIAQPTSFNSAGYSSAFSIQYSTQSLRLGQDTPAFGNHFSGQMDEISIWSEALSENAIREQMCQKLVGTEPNLVAYYRMDEGVDNSCSGGEDVCDLTGNGNHGTKF